MPGRARRRAFLVARELRVGDVVLTSAPKLPVRDYWPTQVIRPMTFSMFTHVSLMATRTGMLDANGPGCTSQVTVPTLRIDADDLLLDVDTSRAVVLRPTLAAFYQAGGETLFRDKVASSALAYLGREYSSEVDLISATWLRAVRRFLPHSDGALLDRWSCSGVVAQVYIDAGVDLVKGDFRRASPGTLKRSGRMRLVPGAVRRLGIQPPQGPLPPATVISGTLSVGRTQPMIERVRTMAESSGFDAAVDWMEGQLTAPLSSPVDGFREHRRFERQLVARGLI